MKYIKFYTIEYNFKCFGQFDIIGKKFTFAKVKLITVSNNTLIPYSNRKRQQFQNFDVSLVNRLWPKRYV